MSESSLIKLQAPRTAALLKRDSKVFEIFKSTLFYRTSPLAASGNFRFPVCNFIKKETLAKMFLCEFCKIFKNIFFFDRTPPDDCFMGLCVNFKKFFETLLL